MRLLLRRIYLLGCAVALGLPYVAFVMTVGPAPLGTLLANRWVLLAYAAHVVLVLGFAVIGDQRIRNRRVPAAIFVIPASLPALVSLLGTHRLVSAPLAMLGDLDRLEVFETLAAAHRDAGTAAAIGLTASAMLFLLAAAAPAFALLGDANHRKPTIGEGGALGVVFLTLILSVGAHRFYGGPPFVVTFWVAAVAAVASARLRNVRSSIAFTAGALAAAAVMMGLGYLFLGRVAALRTSTAIDLAEVATRGDVHASIADAFLSVAGLLFPLTAASKERESRALSGVVAGMVALGVAAAALFVTIRFGAGVPPRLRASRFDGIDLPSTKTTSTASGQHPAFIVRHGETPICDFGSLGAVAHPVDDTCFAELGRIAAKTRSIGKEPLEVLFAVDRDARFAEWSKFVAAVPSGRIAVLVEPPGFPAHVARLQFATAAEAAARPVLFIVDETSAHIGTTDIPLGTSADDVARRAAVLKPPAHIVLAPRPVDELSSVLAVHDLLVAEKVTVALTAEAPTPPPEVKEVKDVKDVKDSKDPKEGKPAADGGAEQALHIVIGNITATPPLPNVERVAYGRRAKLKECYRAALDEDAEMAGKLVLRLRVDTQGKVVGVDIVQNTGLSPKMASCAQASYRSATFDPGDSESYVQIPAVFAPHP